jgi:protein involved in polysaccharide export with SLBB domain
VSYKVPERRGGKPWATPLAVWFCLLLTYGCATAPIRESTCDMTVEPLDLPAPEAPSGLVEPALAIPQLPCLIDAAAPAVSNVAMLLPAMEESLPPPAVPDQSAAADGFAYRIQPFDRLHIEVFGEPDISRTYSVSAAGTVKHPLLDTVQVADRTVEQVEQDITERLQRDFLVNPRVSIRVEQSAGRRVTLLGEVEKTGTLYISPEQRFSLLNVIAAAGGFSDLAAITRVRIIRNVDGEERVIKVNVDDLLKGRSEQGDVDLLPGDVIMVPETFF